MLWPAEFASATPATPTSASHLRALIHAIESHRENKGAYPHAITEASAGIPVSWRVLMLPRLDSNDLFEQYKFDEPWNGPHNRELVRYMREVFARPAEPTDQLENTFVTHYFAIVGPATVWPDSKAKKVRDIPDGREQTILLIEDVNRDIQWSEPRDLSQSEAIELLMAPPSPHTRIVRETLFRRTESTSRGRHVAFANGNVMFLGQIKDPGIAKALLTINGGEKLPPDWAAPFAATQEMRVIFKWGNLGALIVLIALGCLALLWLRYKPRRMPSLDTLPAADASRPE
jgi:hypothetical protein